jgi:hypothetical protein
MSTRTRLNAVEAAIIRNMSDEELEALAAGEPEIEFTDFSIAELEALIDGNASPALEKKYLDARAKAISKARG